MRWKRPLAIAALLFFAFCIAAFLLISLLDIPNKSGYLMAALFAVIAGPAMLYSLFLLLRVNDKKKDDDSEEDQQ